MSVRRLRHGRIELALRSLRDGTPGGRPLLLLHELGGCSQPVPPPEVAAWPGPIHALDFTGHGASTVPAGGGYTAEILMADADVAVHALGGATVVGWGVGAYVALLVAGARPGLVRGAVLADGRGLEGGGPRGGEMLIRPAFDGGGPPDPYALAELSTDARPPSYAQLFARQAVHLSGLPEPIAVAARARTPWLERVLEHPGVVARGVAEALTVFATGA